LLEPPVAQRFYGPTRQNPLTPHAQSKQVSKETHFRGKRDLLYADF
jgi:hypothetical protein